MNGCYVGDFGHTLGSLQRSALAADQAGDLRSSAASLIEAGFGQHGICEPHESAYDLACRALRNSRIITADIDCIVYATCLPANGSLGSEQAFERSRDVKHLMDFPASHLQADFGMQRAFVVGLTQQACTGALGGIRIARNLLLAEPEIENVLCITADRFPPGAIYEQAYNLISDGAAACRVSRNPHGFRILAAHHITNGAMARAGDDETVGCYFNYAHRLVSETLARANLDRRDIRWVVPQNTHRKAWQILASLLRLDPARAWFESMPRCGHVISADNIINLAELEDSGRLASGDRVLTFMAGFGSNWQCLILERT